MIIFLYIKQTSLLFSCFDSSFQLPPIIRCALAHASTRKLFPKLRWRKGGDLFPVLIREPLPSLPPDNDTSAPHTGRRSCRDGSLNLIVRNSPSGSQRTSLPHPSPPRSRGTRGGGTDWRSIMDALTNRNVCDAKYDILKSAGTRGWSFFNLSSLDADLFPIKLEHLDTLMLQRRRRPAVPLMQ